MDAYLSLHRLHVGAGQAVRWPAGIGAALGSGADGDRIVEIDGNTPEEVAGSDMVYLGFMLSAAAIEGPGLLECRRIDCVFPVLFRLDEVSFPPGAQAYRHVHPGPGFRHLRRGKLRLDADDHSFEAMPGDTWFEAAGSPVRATATTEAAETRFVRCMILPPDFEGKPTIDILDPRDAARPKLQTTHRHVDRILDQLDAG